MATHSSTLAWKIPWMEERHTESDTTERLIYIYIYIYTYIYIYFSESKSVKHRELYLILCNGSYGKRAFKKKKEWTHVYISDSLCCTPETNTVLKINSNKNFLKISERFMNVYSRQSCQILFIILPDL